MEPKKDVLGRRLPRFIFDVIDGKQWAFDGDTGKEYGPFESAAEAKQRIKEIRKSEQK